MLLFPTNQTSSNYKGIEYNYMKLRVLVIGVEILSLDLLTNNKLWWTWINWGKTEQIDTLIGVFLNGPASSGIQSYTVGRLLEVATTHIDICCQVVDTPKSKH